MAVIVLVIVIVTVTLKLIVAMLLVVAAGLSQAQLCKLFCGLSHVYVLLLSKDKRRRRRRRSRRRRTRKSRKKEEHEEKSLHLLRSFRSARVRHLGSLCPEPDLRDSLSMQFFLDNDVEKARSMARQEGLINTTR